MDDINIYEITNQTENSKKVYEVAKSLIGQNLATTAVLGCAESVNVVFYKVLGKSIGGGSSTAMMYRFLKNKKMFAQIKGNPLPGDIIISPTGTGNGALAHGNVGIVAKFCIFSNDSADVKFRELFTLDSWYSYYKSKGGFLVEIYRVL